jgi:hypothetical protein
MAAIIDCAIECDIDPSRLTPRVASPAVDLVLHDLIMNRTCLAEETLVEIVDRLFTPGVRLTSDTTDK